MDRRIGRNNNVAVGSGFQFHRPLALVTSGSQGESLSRGDFLQLGGRRIETFQTPTEFDGHGDTVIVIGELPWRCHPSCTRDEQPVGHKTMGLTVEGHDETATSRRRERNMGAVDVRELEHVGVDNIDHIFRAIG